MQANNLTQHTSPNGQPVGQGGASQQVSLPILTHGLRELLQHPACKVAYRGMMTEELRREVIAVLPAYRDAAQPASPEWIAARIRALLAHWKQLDLTDKQQAFIARDWVGCLMGYSQTVLDMACISYMRKGKFRPVPADIVEQAEALDDARRECKQLEALANINPALPAPHMVQETREERAARIAKVDQIMADFRSGKMPVMEGAM